MSEESATELSREAWDKTIRLADKILRLNTPSAECQANYEAAAQRLNLQAFRDFKSEVQGDSAMNVHVVRLSLEPASVLFPGQKQLVAYVPDMHWNQGNWPRGSGDSVVGFASPEPVPCMFLPEHRAIDPILRAHESVHVNQYILDRPFSHNHKGTLDEMTVAFFRGLATSEAEAYLLQFMAGTHSDEALLDVVERSGNIESGVVTFAMHLVLGRGLASRIQRPAIWRVLHDWALDTVLEWTGDRQEQASMEEWLREDGPEILATMAEDAGIHGEDWVEVHRNAMNKVENVV